MKKNNIYTYGYFKKRLKDVNIECFKVDIEYKENDSRYWTTIIFPNTYNIFCTCYKKSKDEYYFTLQTECFKSTIKTLSMEIIINSINELIIENE